MEIAAYRPLDCANSSNVDEGEHRGVLSDSGPRYSLEITAYQLPESTKLLDEDAQPAILSESVSALPEDGMPDNAMVKGIPQVT